MGEISQIQVNGTTYNVKDLAATEALKGKQDALTFDTTPKAGSVNPVTSGGVYSALDGKVNKSGDTMSGSLTIHKGKPAIELNDGGLPAGGTAPPTNRYAVIRANDVEGNNFGYLQFNRTTANVTTARTQIRTPDATKNGFIELIVQPDGTTWATAPTPSPNNDNSTKIATTAWIYANPHIVRTTGTQTIEGNKTFSGNNTFSQSTTSANIYFKSSTIDITTTTGWAVFPEQRWLDKNGKSVAYYRVYANSNNITGVLYRFRFDDGTEADRTLYSVDRANKIIHLYAPTPADSANNTEVATTAWVRNLLKSLGINN